MVKDNSPSHKNKLENRNKVANNGFAYAHNVHTKKVDLLPPRLILYRSRTLKVTAILH